MTMKKTIGIKRNSIIIIIGILLSACTKKENASQQALLLELVQAEAVMYEHPDSALGVLQGMKVPASSDKLQNATWALLTVQAKYKNYKEELADSTLINIAYDYFMKQDKAPIHERRAMGRGKGNNESIILSFSCLFKVFSCISSSCLCMICSLRINFRWYI
jgi:hypothetical protein